MAQTFQPGPAATGAGVSPLKDCRVHLVSITDGQSMVRECGVALSLAPKEFDAWLEAAGWMTPFRTSLRGGEMRPYELPLARAGSVRPRFAESVAAIELWHLEPHEWRNVPARAFHRQALERDSDAVQMPLGRALGIARNSEGKVVALSEPVLVPAESTVDIRPAPPREGGDLVVIIERPTEIAGSADERLLLERDHRQSPDVTLRSADYLLGVWYRLAPGRVAVRMESRSIRLDPLHVVVRGGDVALVRGVAQPLPTLHVNVTAPAGAMPAEALSLRVEHAARGVVGTASLEPGGSTAMRSMPAEPLDVVLSFERWEFRRSVDLSAGLDESVVFALEPIVVEGKVTVGGDAVIADVGFSNTKQLFESRTTADGRYKIVLWQPGRYSLQVRIADRPDSPPYHDTVRIAASRTLDVSIPRARYAVRVLEQATGRPVPGAKVTLWNEYEDETEGRRRILTHVVTDQEGHSYLPSLRVGSLHLRVDADGYVPAESRTMVSDVLENRVVDVSLQPLAAPQVVRLVLPGGAPAASAEVLAITPSGQVLYSATAREDGTIRLPRDLLGVRLLVRHPNAGGGVRLLDVGADAEIVWQLRPAAPPLRLRVVDESGRPAAGSPVFVWIDGHKIGGSALAFLARSISSTSRDGSWTGMNLPATSTRVLVVKRLPGGGAEDGTMFERFAQPVAYPWSAWVNVRAH